MDNDDASDASTWYIDADGDGYGDASTTTTSCDQPSGYVDNNGDCDDLEPLAWTGASELCDGVDNDCDGTVDNDDANDASTWFADADGDGYTAVDESTNACAAPSGYAEASAEADCDDADANIHPGAEEIADDGIDQDCNGADLETQPDDTGEPPGDSGNGGQNNGCGGCASDGRQGSGAGLSFFVLCVVIVGRRRRCA